MDRDNKQGSRNPIGLIPNTEQLDTACRSRTRSALEGSRSAKDRFSSALGLTTYDMICYHVAVMYRSQPVLYTNFGILFCKPYVKQPYEPQRWE